MRFTHSATALPGADPDLDRSICFDGVQIARAFQIEGGQNTGRWQWAGRWSPAEFGIVETLDEALAASRRPSLRRS